MTYTNHFQAISQSVAAIEQAVRNIKSQTLSLTGNPQEDESTLEAVRQLVDGELDGAVGLLENAVVTSADELNSEYALH